MIQAKVGTGSVEVVTTGKTEDLVEEAVVLMAAIRESILEVNPKCAEVFKAAVNRAFEKDLVWESFEWGASQEDAK